MILKKPMVKNYLQRRLVSYLLLLAFSLSLAGGPLSPARAQEPAPTRSEEHTSELQSPDHLVCRLLLEKKKSLPHNIRRISRLCAPRALRAAPRIHPPRRAGADDNRDASLAHVRYSLRKSATDITTQTA